MRGLRSGLAVVGAALALAGSAAAASLVSGLTVGVNDDAGKFDTIRDVVLPDDGRRGLKREHAHAHVGRDRPDDDPRAGRRRERDRGRAGERDHGRARPLPARTRRRSPTGKCCSRRTNPRRAATARKIQQFADWARCVARNVPDRAPVRRHERVQPAAVRQPAVGRGRAEPVRRDLRPRPRGGVRRDQGGQPGELRLGPRALPARQRQRERGENSSTSPVSSSATSARGSRRSRRRRTGPRR